MVVNVGKADRALRIVAGLGIIGAGFYFKSYWGVLGIVPLATAFMRWCPAYIPFKFSSVTKSEQNSTKPEGQ